MHVVDLELPGAKLLTPRRFGDERGFFSETYNRDAMRAIGIDIDFVQDNHSKSVHPGTVRGLHYQAPPAAQTKLVRVIAGAVFDVIVDVRYGSPTYGRHVRVRLDGQGAQLLVPIGFLHGFITLEPNTEVVYKVDAYYSADADGAVRWNDPNLGIDWGQPRMAPTLSDKDGTAQLFRDFKTPFVYRP